MTKKTQNAYQFFCESNAWEVLSEFPNYALSITGEVFSIKRDKFLKIQSKGDYPRVTLRNAGQTVTQYIHVLLNQEFGI